MKFLLQRVSIWVITQNQFQVPQSHSIGENAMLNAGYHRIFLKNSATKEHEIFLA